MADNDDLPTGTTEGATGTTADAVVGSATTPADGSGGGESIEELRKRLQEVERQKAQLLAEKSNVEDMRRELERARGASTPPTAPADPYQAQMAMLTATVHRYGSDSYEGQVAIAQAHALESARRSEYVTNFLVQVERDLLRVPADLRDDVKLKVLNGEFDSVAQAQEAVKGSRSGQTVEELRRELAELKAKVNVSAPRVADVSTGIRTQVDAATHKKVMGLDEYTRIVDAGGSRALEIMAQVDAGSIKLDYS
jgi:hypothetical protein